VDEAGHWVAFVVGVALFVATSISMVKTLIVPRRAWSLLTSALTRAVVWFFHGVARRMRSRDLADRFLGFLGPVAVIGMTVAFLASYALAFALMQLPFTDAELGTALREAGSSVTTLGFESTAGFGPTAIDVLAAVSGLVVIALTIAYLPTLYVILRDRETPVKLVEGRIGPPVNGVRVLTGHHEAAASGELAGLYRSWETWAATVADTHAKYPILLHFRLPRADSNWLSTFCAVLDAAALQLVLDPAVAPGPAQLWLRAGEACLVELRHTLRLEDVEAGVGREPSRESLEQAASELEAVGWGVRPVDDAAFEEWCAIRTRYAGALTQIGSAVLAPGYPWGDEDHRRRPS
jgi:hypothetical protein